MEINGDVTDAGRTDKRTTNEQGKIVLLSQWMLDGWVSQFYNVFSCPEQLIRWPCHSLTDWLTQGTFYFWSTKSNPRDLWPLWHLTRVMRAHDLNIKKTMTKTKTKTKTMTKTNTFRELHQRAILETCDLWDIWSEWWGDMTWPKKDKEKDKDKDKVKDKG